MSAVILENTVSQHTGFDVKLFHIFFAQLRQIYRLVDFFKPFMLHEWTRHMRLHPPITFHLMGNV